LDGDGLVAMNLAGELELSGGGGKKKKKNTADDSGFYRRGRCHQLR
jgi:hypothetical protein